MVAKQKQSIDQHPSLGDVTNGVSADGNILLSMKLAHGLDSKMDNYSTKLVDRVLSAAIEARASDIHWDMLADESIVRWRIDGCLLDIGAFAIGKTSSVAARIKSVAGLLTYRSDIPQEGRMVISGSSIEARVGTLPTLYGERIVIRLAKATAKDWRLVDLGMPKPAEDRLRTALTFSSGVILITGPAGSGKTTTAYACLREIVGSIQSPNSLRQPRAIVSLEDPIEQSIQGIAQSQIHASIGYTWSAGLKAILRQDPEVMLVGEIRDIETANIVFQAALAGQLVISTMHARSAADALRRLMDMQVSPHHLRSGFGLLICQRLMRGLPVQTEAAANQENVGESALSGKSFRDSRILLAENLPAMEERLARLILQDADTLVLQEAAIAAGMNSLWQQSQSLRDRGVINEDEIQRQFGMQR